MPEKQIVPKWAEKNPNLFGLAGAGYEVSKPVLGALGIAVAGGIIGNITAIAISIWSSLRGQQ